MMTKRIDRKIQLTAYWTIILLGAGWIMFKGGFIFLPLIFAFFLAVLLSPVAEFFGKYIKARWISISLAYIVCFVPLILLFYLFALQVVDIAFNLPNIGKSLSMEIHDIYMSIRKHFRVLPSNEVTFLKDNMESLVSGPIAFLGKGIISSSSTLLSLGLAFVFAFFFLLYDRKLVYAINTNFSRKEGNFIETLEKIKYTVKAYVLGLGKVILILSVLNSVGLYLIGLEYAVFFGTLAGLLAIIPFIGTTLGALLPFLYSMATYEDPWQPAIVVIYYIIIQQLEGNVITPKIIGDEVDVNPLVAIISMLFFGAFWGIPGVILSIPLISIVKIILEGFKNTHCIAWLIGSNFNGKDE